MEIIVSKDTNSGLDVQAWSPELECDASGWVRTGHSNERLWTWSDADYSLSAPSPHLPSSQSGHRAVTQPLLADVDLDDAPDLVLAVVDEATDDPTLVGLPLSGATPGAPLWEVALDRGTHPSDPTAVRMDASNVHVVLTTIDASSGAMWAWKVDGGNGALDWERAPVPGTDSDQDAPRLKLPGPVIVQLDADAEPEVILTVPTDPNGRTSGSGARFVAMELTSTTELFSFRAPNGYADAAPLPVDTDGDGIHDRLCWVTWYSTSATSFNRQGMAGCHDITADPPVKEWSRTMERGSGNDNDEIAVAPPLWIDVDGDGPAELLVAFGRKLHCFDGETGAPTDVSTPWEDPVSLPHRTWAAPAAGDMDGDGHLDILIGDMLVSQRQADLQTLSDGRALFFTPEDPDPGEAYTVSARFENVGTEAAQDEVDAVLLKDGDVISRYRLDDLEPIDPSG
ncbi:MAG: VCBS repeat-containing protein, partial [Candidatus Thermoplasmatota archaeon]|nr:VCBS repeat-containing protein [Candidatus Thermoplasmatota archaeon]